MATALIQAAKDVVAASKKTKVPVCDMPELAYQVQVLEIILNHEIKQRQIVGLDHEIESLRKENAELKAALHRTVT